MHVLLFAALTIIMIHLSLLGLIHYFFSFTFMLTTSTGFSLAISPLYVYPVFCFILFCLVAAPSPSLLGVSGSGLWFCVALRALHCVARGGLMVMGSLRWCFVRYRT
jgi:hypothetical protein